jgi:hypothetical protein
MNADERFILWERNHVPSVQNALYWTDKECFEHTKTKYEGVLPRALEIYKLKKIGAGVVSRGRRKMSFTFGYDTCALCVKYRKNLIATTDDAGTICGMCPLKISGKTCGVSPRNPYTSFRMRGTPVPMIARMEMMIGQCQKDGQWKLPKPSPQSK